MIGFVSEVLCSLCGFVCHAQRYEKACREGYWTEIKIVASRILRILDFFLSDAGCKLKFSRAS